MIRWLVLLCFFSANCYGEDWDFKVIKTETVTVEVKPEYYDAYVVMFSSESCGPCRGYKSSGKLDHLKKKFAVRVIDTNTDTSWNSKIARLPTFWLCDKATQTKIHSWEGTVDAEVIEAEWKRQNKPFVTSVPAKTYNSIYGQKGTSHESRATLIDHLLTGAIHRGRHSLSQLNSMTDVQLNKLHEDDHGW